MKKYYIFAAVLGISLALGKNFLFKPVGTQSEAPPVIAAKAYPGGFNIFITSIQPKNNPRIFDLEANIQSENAVGQIEFQWLIFDGVKVLQGPVDPTLTFGENGSVQT